MYMLKTFSMFRIPTLMFYYPSFPEVYLVYVPSLFFCAYRVLMFSLTAFWTFSRFGFLEFLFFCYFGKYPRYKCSLVLKVCSWSWSQLYQLLDFLKVTVVSLLISSIVCLHGWEGSVKICQFCFKWEGVYFYKSGFQCCHLYVSQKSHQT